MTQFWLQLPIQTKEQDVDFWYARLIPREMIIRKWFPGHVEV